MKIVYQLTKNDLFHRYGILVREEGSLHAYHTAPFLENPRQARRLVNFLNQEQYPIDDFCDLFLRCELLSLLKKGKKSPQKAGGGASA